MAGHSKEAFMALIVLACSMFDGTLAMVVLLCMLIAANVQRARHRNRIIILGPPVQPTAELMGVSIAKEPQGLIALGLMPYNSNPNPASSKTSSDFICQPKATLDTSPANPSLDTPEVTIKPMEDEGANTLDANSLWSELSTGCRRTLADPRLQKSTNLFLSESEDHTLAAKKTPQETVSELEALTSAMNGFDEDGGDHPVAIPLPDTPLIDPKPEKESFSSLRTVGDENNLQNNSDLEPINNTSPAIPPFEKPPSITEEDEDENPDNDASALRLGYNPASTHSPSVYYEAGRRLALKRLKFVASDHTGELKNADPTESAFCEEKTVERDLTISTDQDIMLLSREQLSWLTSKKYLRRCQGKSKRSNCKTSRNISYIKGKTVRDFGMPLTVSRLVLGHQPFQPTEAPDTKYDKKQVHSPVSLPEESVAPTKPVLSIPTTPPSPPGRNLENFPLFDLPRELRDLVYGFAVGGKLLHFSGYNKKPYQLCIEAEQENSRNHWRCFASSKRRRWNQVLPIIPLLLTSKQVHWEVLPIVYGTNYFSFLNFNALKNFNSKYSRRTKIASLEVPQKSNKASPKGSSSSDNDWLNLNQPSPTGTRTRRLGVRSTKINDSGRLDRPRRGNQVFSGIRVYDPAAHDRRLSLIRFDLEFFAWLDASRPQPKGDTLSHVSDYPSQDILLAFRHSKEEPSFASQVQEYREHPEFMDKTHSARIILISGNIPESTNLRAIDRTIYRILGNMTWFVPHLQDLTGEVRCDVKGLDMLMTEDTRARDLGVDRDGEDCRGSEVVRRGNQAFCDFVVKVLSDKLSLDDCFRFWHVYCWKELEPLPELYGGEERVGEADHLDENAEG